MLTHRSISLTQKWQKNGIVVGHDEQVDTVQSRAGLQVAKRLTQVTVLGTVAHKHLEDRDKTHSRVSGDLLDVIMSVCVGAIPASRCAATSFPICTA